MEINKIRKRYLLKAGGLGGLLLLLFLLILSSKTARADLLNVKLSDPLQPHTTITQVKISPDGEYALFRADIITENAFELYSVPMDGSEPPTLLSSGLMPAGVNVSFYHISPDSSRVVYPAMQDTFGKTELYSVAINGGPITKLNPPIVGDGNGTPEFRYVELSQDSSRVVFMAALQFEGIYELFSVPIGGGTPVRLNGDLPIDGTVASLQIAPNNSHVVYSASEETAFMYELYIVSINGDDNRKLSDPLPPGGWVGFYKISPDGSRVVYTAMQEVFNKWEIFSVYLMDPAATPIKLNPPMGVNSDVVYHDFKISPDSSKVVYVSDQLINDVNLFYSVPIGGGAALQLTNIGDGVPEINQYEDSFEISPNSNRLVFRADKGKVQLFSVPLTGGTVTMLNDPIIPVTGEVKGFRISPDSSRVVYLAEQDAYSYELYSVPIGGGQTAKLNSVMPSSSSDVKNYQISNNSQRVVYVADQQVVGVEEIYSVPLADGDITKLNPPLVDGGIVKVDFQISPNSNHVVYPAVQETIGVTELFVTFEETSPPPGGAYRTYLPFIHN
jgi:Tol biopolymer transport system component